MRSMKGDRRTGQSLTMQMGQEVGTQGSVWMKSSTSRPLRSLMSRSMELISSCERSKVQ